MRKLKKVLRITGFTLSGVLLLALVGSTVNNRIGNCKVEGEIKGLGTTLALVSGGTNSHNKNFFKFILVWNDRFSFNADLDEAGGGRIISRNMFFKRQSGKPLWMRSRIISFNLNPNEQINIEGEMKSYSIDYVIEGNLRSEQMNQFRKMNLALLEKESKTALMLDKLEYEGAPREKIDAAHELFDKIREEYNQQRLAFALSHPTFEISANFLQSQERDTIIKYFPVLAENVKQTYEGKLLQERIKAWGQIVIGKTAPAFTGTTIDGKAFSLSDMKGKSVVLDFWGSWCGPCISGFPRMKDYHSKYKGRLEFIGIACKDSEAVWKRTVEEHNLEWKQLLNRDQDKFDITYAVKEFPTKVLIDAEGNLMQTYVGESDEFYQKLDELFQD